MSTRREFLLNCSTVAAATALAPATVLASRQPLRQITLDQISVAALLAQLNSYFTARNREGVAVALQLIGIEADDSSRTAAAPDEGNETCSLLFAGNVSQALLQGTH